MRVFLTICAVLLGLCLTFGCARAEVDSTEILIKALVNKGIITQQDADAVRDEIAELKKEDEAKQTAFTVTGKRPIKVAGYLHEKYTSSSAAGVQDGFEVRRARLGITGDATDKLDFKASWELSGTRTAVSSVNFGTSSVTTTKVGKPILVDMALGYKLPDDRRIQIGQFHVPFSIESLLPASKIDFINRPRVVDRWFPAETRVTWQETKVSSTRAGLPAGNSNTSLRCSTAQASMRLKTTLIKTRRFEWSTIRPRDSGLAAPTSTARWERQRPVAGDWGSRPSMIEMIGLSKGSTFERTTPREMPMDGLPRFCIGSTQSSTALSDTTCSTLIRIPGMMPLRR